MHSDRDPGMLAGECDLKKTEIISFKADAALLEALDGVDNRSRFIRNAIVTALRNTCPLCGGTGALTPNQQKHWEELSANAIQRVKAEYNWELYARRLLSLSRIYGFWKYITNIEREETRRYLEMFYGLMYRPLAEKLRGPGLA